jgi:hypothetical protein
MDLQHLLVHLSVDRLSSCLSAPLCLVTGTFSFSWFDGNVMKYDTYLFLCIAKERRFVNCKGFLTSEEEYFEPEEAVLWLY